MELCIGFYEEITPQAKKWGFRSKKGYFDLCIGFYEEIAQQTIF